MRRLTLNERAASYRAAFPDMPGGWPDIVSYNGHDALRGEWQFGQDYRNRSAFYGAYPGNYLDRLSALFPEYPLMAGVLPFEDVRVLHAFSGSLPPGPYDRCDVVQEAEHCCDVRELPTRVGDATYDFIAADPPYSDDDAEKYQAPPVDRGACTSALAAVAKPGAFLAWLDTTWPMHAKAEWMTIGKIYVLRSTNHRVRLLTIFQRVEAT